jgi:hypothetical protein
LREGNKIKPPRTLADAAAAPKRRSCKKTESIDAGKHYTLAQSIDKKKSVSARFFLAAPTVENPPVNLNT